MTSIRDRWCVRCGIHTPTLTYKSMVGEVTKCLKCQYEKIIYYDGKTDEEFNTRDEDEVIS